MSRVVLDTDLAGYPANNFAGYPANIFAGEPANETRCRIPGGIPDIKNAGYPVQPYNELSQIIYFSGIHHLLNHLYFLLMLHK